MMPCDIPDMSVKGISKLLDTGNFSIAFIYVGPIPVALIGAREIGRGRVNSSLIKHSCSLQGNRGCKLAEEDRPTMGLLYVPTSSGCKLLLKPEEVVEAWFPYQEVLEEVIMLETGKTSLELFEDSVEEDLRFLQKKAEKNIPFTHAEDMAISLLNEMGYF